MLSSHSPCKLQHELLLIYPGSLQHVAEGFCEGTSLHQNTNTQVPCPNATFNHPFGSQTTLTGYTLMLFQSAFLLKILEFIVCFPCSRKCPFLNFEDLLYIVF
jgi:hypothetical protein